MQQATKKIQRAWSMYDWANSAYNLVITSTIFPAYYIAITGGDSGAKVSFFGWRIVNSTLLEYALSFAYFIIALLSPILSSIADYRGNKKRYMQFYCYLGVLSCFGLFWFVPGATEIGIIFSVLAAIGFCGSLVFYNAYLPEIAPVAQQDKLSAQGFAYGYVGSVILQLICFVFVFNPGLLGATKADTIQYRFCFVLVAVWWLLFATYSFKYLPKAAPSSDAQKDNIWSGGFKELKKVWHQVQKMPTLKTYLLAFFFYSMGVQTVMLAATIFGSKEVKKLQEGKWVAMQAEDLIPVILIIQLVAILGATLMAKLSRKYGNLQVLTLVVSLWVGICIAAFYTYTDTEFYVLAVCVGLLMGGIQSLSRSTYSKFIPKDSQDSTSFFSLYDVMEKMSIVLGMFSFAFIEHMFSSMRYSIIALTLFFIIGFLLLLLALKKKNRQPITAFSEA